MTEVVLLVDTSTPRAAVGMVPAGADAGAQFDFRVGRAEQSHHEELPELVAELRSRLTAGDRISEIVIGQGPGSFTGLRIGYSYVLGLAYSLNVPVRQICTLGAFALPHWAASKGSRRVLATLAAGRGEMFVGGLEAAKPGGAKPPGSEMIFLAAQIMGPSVLAEAAVDAVVLEVAVKEERESGGHLPLLSGLWMAHKCGVGVFASYDSGGYARPTLAPKSLPGSNTADLAACRGAQPSFTPNYVRQVAARTIAERE